MQFTAMLFPSALYLSPVGQFSGSLPRHEMRVNPRGKPINNSHSSAVNTLTWSLRDEFSGWFVTSLDMPRIFWVNTIGIAVCPSSAVVFIPLCILAVRGLAASGGNGVPHKFLSSLELEPSATCVNARCNAVGSFFPRFSARRRIPAHAFGVK